MAYMNLLHYHSVQLPPMNCKILLDAPDKAFSAGDAITGRFTISCAKELYSFGIRIALEGTALAKFKDQGGVQTKTDTIAQSFTFVHGKGDVRVRLAPGDHEFPFSLRLFGLGASGLPGSFKSPFGLILYQLVAYVQLEWKFVRKAEKTIQVISYYNLALQDPSASALAPLCVEKVEKSILPSLISRTTSKFRFTLRLSHTGFLGGEQINFELELENPASYEVTVKQLTLVQKIIYNGGNSNKVKQKVVTRVQSSGSKLEDSLWKEFLQVPYGLMPTQKGIIDVQYILKVEVKTQGQCTLRADIPIIIGTTREMIQSQLLSPDVESQSASASGSGKRDRDRSPSPNPLTRCRSSGQTRSGSGSATSHHKLDRAESAAACPSSAGSRRPPRYSLLSFHKAKSTSSDTDSLPPPPPPPYDSVDRGGKSPECESLEILEFKKSTKELDIDLEEEQDEILEDDPADIELDTPTNLTLTPSPSPATPTPATSDVDILQPQPQPPTEQLKSINLNLNTN